MNTRSIFWCLFQKCSLILSPLAARAQQKTLRFQPVTFQGPRKGEEEQKHRHTVNFFFVLLEGPRRGGPEPEDQDPRMRRRPAVVERSKESLTRLFQLTTYSLSHLVCVLLCCMKSGGFCSNRTCVFSGIQITRHFIEFVVVETKQIVSSNSDVILTRQTCGQHSEMTATSKRRVLAFDFSVRMCCIFLLSKCREESNLGLCMTLGLSKRMLLRSPNFRRVLRANIFKNRKSALYSSILFASP